MNSLRILSMTLFLAAFSSAAFSQNANQSSASTTFFVRIDNLTVDNYPGLYHAIKADGRLKISQACVPAQILTIQILDAQNADLSKSFQDFQALAANFQLTAPVLLADFNADRFFDACLAVRNHN